MNYWYPTTLTYRTNFEYDKKYFSTKGSDYWGRTGRQ